MTGQSDTQAEDGHRPLMVGPWRVEPIAGLITRSDRSVKLEPRVMDVLVYLARRPSQVVSREELEASVWAGRIVGYDALTSAMLKLRKALEDDAREPRFIETVSKKGYRLVAPVQTADSAAVGHLGPEASQPRRARLWGAALGVIALLAGGVIVELSPREPGVGGSVLPASSQPSIAVLPFDNLSDDSAQEYFADGMTDDLITELAKIPDLFVIARDSTFLYKHEPVDVREVADKLKVRYLLRGSVRRTGGAVRINAQLIDTQTGAHLWAERYDGTARDILGLQDAITRKILSALALKLQTRNGPAERVHGTPSPAAYDYYLLGRNRFFRYASKEENRRARELYQQAIDLDPDFAPAYAMLAWTDAFDAMNGWSDERDKSLESALGLATRAIEMDKTLPVAYFVTGLVHRERGEYLEARSEAQKALELEPSYANAHILLATLFYYTGEPRKGLELVERAMRLNPHHPYNYPFHLGQAHFILGEYPEAIDALEKGLASNPSSERMRVWLAAAYARAGRVDDAKWEAEQVLTLNPSFSLEHIQRAFPFKNPADLDQFVEGLRIAGLSR